MEKSYNPNAIESACYANWESQGYFKAPETTTPGYCIVLPPPNVTGSLHMGHGFQHTLMDALIRYQRMQGNPTLWQGGTDHAGIATQMVVERQLAQDNISRYDLGRETFLDKVWAWKAISHERISKQLRRMGSSIDWSRERFTMDDTYSEAVRNVFIRLYDEGLIYRGKRLVNWDPKFQTAISDLEVISEETQGSLWTFKYPLTDGTGAVEIATTRPETLLGDTAVAVNPDDTRYTHLIGKTVRLPLCDRDIPIVADGYVDPEFGTGCVKITPAHDFNDYALGQRHHLPMLNIMTPDAHLNDTVPEAYRGLTREAARKAVLNDLKAGGFFVKEENHALKVPRGDRSGVVIEPYLTDQWFVKAGPLAEPALEVVKQGKLKFVPEQWTKTYNQWLENIEDWCISRQLWWGHRIPAWYDESGQIYVANTEAQAREKYALPDTLQLSQDEDVLDTWFSSALWPFATLGWPDATPQMQAYFPNQVLVTGFDIIFFWVARMVMFSLKFTGEIPFHEVYVTGLIRDGQGQKMSKSKGNVIDPIDLIDGISLEDLVAKRTTGLMQPEMAAKIEKQTRKEFPEGINAYGTDAVRFTFCALATNGRDIRFDLGRVEGYHFFCNKLWNATRFVLMSTEGFTPGAKPDAAAMSLADKWILSALQTVIEKVHQGFETYRFDLLAQAVYEFIWDQYCDWYLELTKPILNNPNTPLAEKNATQWTLLTVLETLLRLIHPLMPFITETLWKPVCDRLGVTGDTIMLASYPTVNVSDKNPEVEATVSWLKEVISGVRTIRSELHVSPSKEIVLLCQGGTPQTRERCETLGAFIQTLTRATELTWLDDTTSPPPAATAIVEDLQILVPLAGLIDTAAETARLEKAIEKLKLDIDKTQTRLDNPNYRDKAPAEVVEKEQSRLEGLHAEHAQLTEKLNQIAALSEQ